MPYSELLTLVERTFGRRPATPHDFDQLSASIQQLTRQTVSVSTLKRLWGYVPSVHQPRQDVLDILSLYCGYASWAAFQRALSENDLPTESNLVLGQCLQGDSIPKGRLLRLLWKPQSACTFRSLGYSRFEVVASSGSKLPVGATFICRQFIQGEPLYLTDLLLNEGAQPVGYVCGRDSGIRIL